MGDGAWLTSWSVSCAFSELFNVVAFVSLHVFDAVNVKSLPWRTAENPRQDQRTLCPEVFPDSPVENTVSTIEDLSTASSRLIPWDVAFSDSLDTLYALLPRNNKFPPLWKSPLEPLPGINCVGEFRRDDAKRYRKVHARVTFSGNDLERREDGSLILSPHSGVPDRPLWH